MTELEMKLEMELEHYIMMLKVVEDLQYQSATVDKCELHYLEQINKCLEELNAE